MRRGSRVYQLQGKRDGSKVLSKSTPQPTNSARILLPLQLPTAPVLLPPLNPRDETTQTTRWNGLIPPALASKLSAVAPKETVSVWDLVNHYRSDPLAADTRYRKRAFLVTGVVERMEKGLLTRNVRVFLESPDPAVQPVCDWRIDDKIAAFYTRRDGRTLTVLEGRSKRTLLEAGDKVTFEVRGGGLSDGLIELQKALRQ